MLRNGRVAGRNLALGFAAGFAFKGLAYGVEWALGGIVCLTELAQPEWLGWLGVGAMALMLASTLLLVRFAAKVGPSASQGPWNSSPEGGTSTPSFGAPLPSSRPLPPVP